jgi:hypothetical protein
MRIALKILAARILVDFTCGALLRIFVGHQAFKTRCAAGGKTSASKIVAGKHRSALPLGPQQADQAIVCRMAIALGVAVLGSLGVCLTIVELDSGSASRGIGMITAAAASRAGAIVSVTQMEFEERLVGDQTSRDQNRRQQSNSAYKKLAELVATDNPSSARHHCHRAHGLCNP